MALHFNYKNVTGPKTNPDNPENMHPVLVALIWYTIPIGLNEITEKNLEEWRFRLAFYDKVRGTIITNQAGDVHITDEELKSYIGLTTNASPMTRPQFIKNTVRSFTEDWNRENR